MKKALVFTLCFILTIYSYAQVAKVENTIKKAFDAMAVLQFEKMKETITDDLIVLENGAIWNIDTLINKMQPLRNIPDFKRLNSFKFLHTKVSGNIAYTYYYNEATITANGKTTNKMWLESAVLIKINANWKIKLLHSTPIIPLSNKKDMTTNKLLDFGKMYAKAWCSQKPDNVASFFSENGMLTVNNGTPAVGRAAISKVAESFMTAFPDITVSMDSLPATQKGLEFHWTLTGTNTGPNGTGKKVRISGFEVWQLDDKGLINQSQGSFDADEYNRQLK